MSVDRLDQLNHFPRNGGDVLRISHIRDGGIFGDVQPGVVAVIEGRFAGELGHAILVQAPGDAQLVFEERKACIVLHGAGG